MQLLFSRVKMYESSLLWILKSKTRDTRGF